MQEVITKPSDFNKYYEEEQLSPITEYDMIIDSMFFYDNEYFSHIPILSDEAMLKLNDIFDYIHSGAPIMFISACHGLDINKEHTIEEIEENEIMNRNNSMLLNKDLDKICNDNYWLYLKVNGHWIERSKLTKQFIDTPEYSFMVIGCWKDEYIAKDAFKRLKKVGIELCNKYNQKAVMIGRKIIVPGQNRFDKDNFDFSYYNERGIRTSNYKKYKLDSGEHIKHLAEDYTNQLHEYNKNHFIMTEKEKEKLKELVKQYYGATAVKDIDTDEEVGIVFESITFKNEASDKFYNICDEVKTL